MKTHDFPGGFFTGTLNLDDDGPRFHLAPVREVDPPFRACYRSPHIRVLGKKGIVLGRWRRSQETATEHLMHAVRGHCTEEK